LKLDEIATTDWATSDSRLRIPLSFLFTWFRSQSPAGELGWIPRSSGERLRGDIAEMIDVTACSVPRILRARHIGFFTRRIHRSLWSSQDLTSLSCLRRTGHVKLQFRSIDQVILASVLRHACNFFYSRLSPDSALDIFQIIVTYIVRAFSYYNSVPKRKTFLKVGLAF
jgi:hypothetical protein